VVADPVVRAVSCLLALLCAWDATVGNLMLPGRCTPGCAFDMARTWLRGISTDLPGTLWQAAAADISWPLLSRWRWRQVLGLSTQRHDEPVAPAGAAIDVVGPIGRGGLVPSLQGIPVSAKTWTWADA
jgi:hypothetical protein